MQGRLEEMYHQMIERARQARCVEAWENDNVDRVVREAMEAQGLTLGMGDEDEGGENMAQDNSDLNALLQRSAVVLEPHKQHWNPPCYTPLSLGRGAFGPEELPQRGDMLTESEGVLYATLDDAECVAHCMGGALGGSVVVEFCRETQLHTPVEDIPQFSSGDTYTYRGAEGEENNGMFTVEAIQQSQIQIMQEDDGHHDYSDPDIPPMQEAMIDAVRQDLPVLLNGVLLSRAEVRMIAEGSQSMVPGDQYIVVYSEERHEVFTVPGVTYQARPNLNMRRIVEIMNTMPACEDEDTSEVLEEDLFCNVQRQREPSMLEQHWWKPL